MLAESRQISDYRCVMRALVAITQCWRGDTDLILPAHSLPAGISSALPVRTGSTYYMFSDLEQPIAPIKYAISICWAQRGSSFWPSAAWRHKASILVEKIDAASPESPHVFPCFYSFRTANTGHHALHATRQKVPGCSLAPWSS